ncbi:hypothetical protein CYMTET_41009 [Cymbomonas tetramitiformis]|uniref:Uncharacterized protein n=1 Tax=Cymbomonas tetramitiformis TaxID=36881 RepID=A0AAE0F2N5_9CHLO|nr:hypothetical protein CYMTET_41009 [Cymbomonas tetramitiformis]
MNPEATVFDPSKLTKTSVCDAFECKARSLQHEQHICSLQGQILILRELAGLPVVSVTYPVPSHAHFDPALHGFAQPTPSTSGCAGGVFAREGWQTDTAFDALRRSEWAPSANSVDHTHTNGSSSDSYGAHVFTFKTPQRDVEIQCAPEGLPCKTVASQSDIAVDNSVCACTQTSTVHAPTRSDAGTQCAPPPKVSSDVSVQCDAVVVVTDERSVERKVVYGWKAMLSCHTFSMLDDDRVRKIVGASTVRKSRAVAKLFRDWFAIYLRGKQRTQRMSVALARWRGVHLREMTTNLQEKESNLYELEDDHHMTTEQNKDLALTVDGLRFELKEQENRLVNARASCTELLKRLRISGECIKAMQKGFVIHCNMCRKVMLRMTGNDSCDSICSIQATEECDNEEDNAKILDFAHTHLTHATMANVIPLRGA